MSPPAEAAGVNSFRANLGLVVHGQGLRTGRYTRIYEGKTFGGSKPETALFSTTHRCKSLPPVSLSSLQLE